MSATGWTSRRALRFADLVEAPALHVVDAPDPRLEELLVTVGALRSLADTAPAPRPQFVVGLRERLLEQAETDLVPAPERLILDRQSTSRRSTRLAAAGVALVLAGGTAGVAVAAEKSLPGQSLYTLKRGLETTGGAFQLGRAERGRYELHQADTRLDELTELVRRGDDDQVSGTLSRFTGSAGSGADQLFAAYQAESDPADATAVREFASSAVQRLSGLVAQASGADRPQLRRAADLLASLDREAQVLCGHCGSASAMAMPAAFVTDAPLTTLPPAAQVAADAAQPVTVPGRRASELAAAVRPGAGTTAAPPAGTTPAAASPGASGVATSATGAAGPVKGKLPKAAVPTAVSSVASQAGTAVNGVIDAAGNAVTGTLNGVVNGATGLLGGTPAP